MDQDYIIGRNPVIEVLKSSRDINKIWVAENSLKGQAQQITTLAKEKGVTINFVPKKKIDQMVEGNHQGVVAQVAAYEYVHVDDILAIAEKKGGITFSTIAR